MMSFSAGWVALKGMPLSELWPIVGLPAFFFTLLGIFAVRCARHGMPRTERMEKLSKSRFVPRFLLEYGYWILYLPVRGLVAVGATPNMVTAASLLVAGAGAVLFASGRFFWGGFLLYVSFMFDALDGMVARATGMTSVRGEYFDAFIDRYTDFVVYLGIMWYYRDFPLALGLTTMAMVGSSVMGYARAKGEAVGIDPNVGWMQRHERAAVVGSLTCLSPLAAIFLEPGNPHPRHHLVIVAMAAVALFSNITSIQRAWYVMSRLAPARRRPAPEAVAPPAPTLGKELAPTAQPSRLARS